MHTTYRSKDRMREREKEKGKVVMCLSCIYTHIHTHHTNAHLNSVASFLAKLSTLSYVTFSVYIANMYVRAQERYTQCSANG